MFVFGCNIVGTGNTNIAFPSANGKSTSLFTLGTTTNDIDKLLFYSNNAYGSAKVKGVIYANNSGDPGALLHATSELVGVAAGWNELFFASAIDLTAGDYFLGLIADTEIVTSCNATGNNKYNNDTYSDGPTDPFGTPSTSSYQKPIFASKPSDETGANYVTDFSEHTVDQQPSDWTVEWHTTDQFKVRSASSGYGQKFLEFLHSTDERHALSWDDPGSVYNADVLVRFRPEITNDWTGYIFIRGSGDSTSEQGYRVAIINDVLYLGKYVNAIYTEIATIPWDYSAETYYRIRFRANEDSLKIRVWADYEEEPATWDIEATDYGISLGGWIGVGGFGCDCDWDFFSVGTGGNAAVAPTDPDTDARITQQAVEVLRAGDPDARITQQVVEIIRMGSPNARITQQVIEVLRAVAADTVQAAQPIIFIVT